MKSTTSVVVALLAASVDAHPQVSGLVPSLVGELTTLTSGLVTQLTDLGQEAVGVFQTGTEGNATFDASKQLIDVTGDHAWQAPGPNDARGPCPGLNALANHGYLPRDGFGTIFDFVDATTEVFGMGLDLATILAAYGAVFDGVGIGWSVGGGFHTGISGSRGHYETDSSPMRADLNQYGSNVEVVVEQFQELFNLQPDAATANYDINVLAQFRKTRFHESIAKNPYFYYGPFAGTTVSQAAFTFIYRFMANHTAEAPDGILNQDVLKSFFSMTGNNGSFVWTPGHERIPDNWYRRSMAQPYTLNGLGDDSNTLAAVEPSINTPGCNTGKVNSFTAISSFSNSTSAYNFADPLQGVCYAVALAAGPIINELPVVSTLVEQLLVPFQNVLGCPTVPSKNATVGSECPGYSFYGGPTGQVAPGAIQS